MINVFGGKLTLSVGDESITFDAMTPVEDVGEHSHSVCMLDSFIGDHRDYDPEREFDEPAPNLGEISEWALEMERLLNESDDYDEEVPDYLLEIIAEFDEIIGKTTSVGKLEESVEDPDDPCEGLGVTLLEIPVPEPLSILVIHSEGRDTEPNPSSSVPRSRPPLKRTRTLIDSSELGRMQTPSVGTSRVDKLLRYLNQVVFGPGSVDRGFVLDSVRKIVENEVPVPPVREAFGKSFRGTRRTNQEAVLKATPSRYARSGRLIFRGFIILPVLNLHSGGIDYHLYEVCKGNPAVCATVTEMLYSAHKDERSWTIHATLPAKWIPFIFAFVFLVVFCFTLMKMCLSNVVK
ncbi:hypothetical protein L1987_16316 [Smallanthus sonchifolius]|uniref:Uncharacterized protein n=1 Tax=Smallanthus sonchifolius TaxID=185202 RepID=A0ACB9J9J6_9ASTR|nr:hypothetical protein L1987_16316 [Smallanthus sonchifolius]